MLKQTNAKITLVLTLLFGILFTLIFNSYMLPSFKDQIMKNTVNDAKKISHYLIKEYKDEDRLAELNIIKKHLGIYKIKLFDPTGLTIFSTSKKNIGKINKHSHFQDIVAKGNSYYKIVKKGKKALEGQYIELDIAEVYIPIMENGVFINAFEIYYDISSEVNNFNNLILKLRIVNFSIVLLFTILMIFILFRTSKANIKEKENQEKLLSEQSKMATMGKMIDAIAHQWKQPLATINSTVQSLDIKIMLGKKLDNKYMLEVSKSTREQVEHLISTIDEFRQFFRPNQEQTIISVKKLINSTLSLMEDTLISNSIEAEVIGEDNIKVSCMPNEFKHVFINLINNSKDAFIEKDIKKRKIIFEILKNDNKVIVTISDNAGGIPDKIIKNIFKSNFTTKEEGKGTGVGLYLTKQIIEKQNSTIEAKNIDVGVKFTISLPPIG